eukprot:scaffold5447_cov430-Prasinococcus_capsulatus_cf.AAC.3
MVTWYVLLRGTAQYWYMSSGQQYETLNRSVVLSVCYLQYNCLAISASLFCIVFISVILGTVLPFGLNKLGVDPANAGTTIQVLMDIMGVTITCLICTLVLDSGFVALPFD